MNGSIPRSPRAVEAAVEGPSSQTAATPRPAPDRRRPRSPPARPHPTDARPRRAQQRRVPRREPAAGRWKRPVNDVTPSRAAAPHRSPRPAPQPEVEVPPQSPSGEATCPLPSQQQNGPTALAAGRTPPDLTGPATCDFCSCVVQRPNAPPVTAIPPNGAFDDVESPVCTLCHRGPKADGPARTPDAGTRLRLHPHQAAVRHRVSAGYSATAIRSPSG